jgi:hypothetical protein
VLRRAHRRVAHDQADDVLLVVRPGAEDLVRPVRREDRRLGEIGRAGERRLVTRPRVELSGDVVPGAQQLRQLALLAPMAQRNVPLVAHQRRAGRPVEKDRRDAVGHAGLPLQ